MNRKSKDPKGYIWHSEQIAKMLKNEVYIGSVVGRKFQKISHKVEKVRSTHREEYIIVKNMHEPIIDELTWRKAQDKLNKHKNSLTQKYEVPLKEFIFCAECGGKATYKVRKGERKSGKVWEQRTFLCSNKNRNKSCTCKPITEELIQDEVKKVIKEEIEQISYTEDEIINVYKKAEEKVHSKTNILRSQKVAIQNKIDENEQTTQEVYQDKIHKLITADDFAMIYNKLQSEKKELLMQIHQIETEMMELQKEDTGKNYIEMIKLAKDMLQMKNPSKEIYSKLIKKIEFDSNKNITVTLTFGNIKEQEKYEKAV